MPGRLDEIYISPKSAEPMQALQQVNLIAGMGLEGDRYNYAVHTGTYSASFIDEPGKNCTVVSADAVEKQMAATGMKPFEGGLGALRRNLVVRGLSGDELNDMVGHEVQIGSCRLFVHRRTVPCKYREAQCKRPGLMNRLWHVCGVNCEILKGGTVCVGDEVAVIPGTHQPKRINPGMKPPGFFVRPADRTHEQHASMVIPPVVAFQMCLVDPAGFERIEYGYRSVGAHFWTPQAYRAGQLAKKLRPPLVVAVVAAVLALVVKVLT